MTIERRKHQRYPLFLDLRLTSASGRPQIRLSDLSLGGCYIDTVGHMAAGEQVSFEIKVPAEGWVPFHGTVAYAHQGYGFGVCFPPLSEDLKAVVNRLISFSAACAVTAPPAQLSAYAA